MGPIIPPGPTPATYRNWGAGAHAGGIATSRSQYLNYRFVDWQGTPSRGICEAGGLLAAAIGRTGSVFASGGPFVARRVVRRLFRYEAESIHPGQVAAYDAAYGQIDPNQSRSWRNYRDLFRNFWADTGTAPYLYMLTVIQPWTLAGYGVALPNPF